MYLLEGSQQSFIFSSQFLFPLTCLTLLLKNQTKPNIICFISDIDILAADKIKGVLLTTAMTIYVLITDMYYSFGFVGQTHYYYYYYY